MRPVTLFRCAEPVPTHTSVALESTDGAGSRWSGCSPVIVVQSTKNGFYIERRSDIGWHWRAFLGKWGLPFDALMNADRVVILADVF